MSTEPVEDYLDQLLVALAGGPPRAVRDQLAEAEAHLHDAVDEDQRRGLSRLDAERDAVARFGQASVVAALERRRLTPTPGRLLLDTLRVGWWLGAIGAIAVGVSGVVAWVLTVVAGPTFLAGRPPGPALTASACSRWLSGPDGPGCVQAGAADWAHDVSWSRLACGLLGVAAMAAWTGWRRHARGRPASTGVLPPVLIDGVATLAFAAAATWLTGQAIDAAVVTSGRGAGQWLSAAPVALLVAGVFAGRLLRDLGLRPLTIRRGRGVARARP